MPDLTAGAGSLRRAGLASIAISGVAAVLWYLSLTIVARRFGGSLGSDAYYFLLSLTTVASGFLSCLFGAIFLPIFIELKVKQGMREAAAFAAAVLWSTIAVALPLALASFLAYGPFFSLLSKFSAVQIAQARFVLIYFAPIFLAQVLAEFFRVMALALGRYIVVAAGAILQPAMLIGVLVVPTHSLQEGALALSLLAARLAMLTWMVILVARHGCFPWAGALRGAASMRRFFTGAAPYWSANVVTSLASFAFDYMATGLGVGVLSAVSYAQRLFMLPITVLLTPILEVARTRFAETRSSGADPAFALLHNQLLQFVIYSSVPMAALYLLLPRELVAAIFQHGAFTAEYVAIAASCLQVYACVIPLTSVFMLNGRALESSQRLGWPSLFGTLGNLLSIALTFALVHRYGYIGIPWAKLAIEALFFFPFGFIALRLLTGPILTQSLTRVSLVAGLAAALPAAIYRATGVDDTLHEHTPNIGLLAAVTAVLFAAYALLVTLLDARVRSLVVLRLRALANAAGVQR